MSDKLWIRRDLEGIRPGLTRDNHENLRIAGNSAEIWTDRLQNSNPEPYF
jgi:hypothetical protein